MKLKRKMARALVLSAFLLSMTPTLSPAQDVERGYDGDQSVKSGQRDNEDHETSLDWIGFFGLLGLVGLVGPKRRRDQRERMMKRALVASTVLAASVALSVGTPALSQKPQNDRGYSIESSQQGKGDRPISIGWVGLIGLAGLLGLGLPWKKKQDS